MDKFKVKYRYYGHESSIVVTAANNWDAVFKVALQIAPGSEAEYLDVVIVEDDE